MVIGLTGNSGSGKGAVSEIMSENGALILDCDKIAHNNMQPSGIAYNDIVNSFGSGILDDTGSINRGILGDIVFKNPEKLRLLNSITHGYIKQEVLRKISENKDIKCIVIDAPLLFEAGFDSFCDSIWTVTAPLDIRLKRVIERDGISKERALKRFENQPDSESLSARSDVVITNDGSLDELKERVINEMNNKELI